MSKVTKKYIRDKAERTLRRVGIKNKKQTEEVNFSSGGKVFSAKIPRKLNHRIEKAIEEHEFASNSAFVTFSMKIALLLLEDHAKGKKLYGRSKEGKLTEYKILV